MSADWPREGDATVALEAAARKVYESSRQPSDPAWRDLLPGSQNAIKSSLLPIVWAALDALPDPRRGAWLEGYLTADNGGDVSECPYSS